jgi:hypothetical protein
MTRVLWTVVLLASIGALMQVSVAASIEQQLIVVINAKTLNGDFQVALQVKGTDLTAANTLGSATVDVVFENTKLSFQGSSGWAFGSSQGYARTATNNTTYIRVGVLGTTVNGDEGGLPAGIDIGTSYVTWVQLNFKILDPNSSTNVTIASGSNAIGVFGNHSNEPLTGVINNQPLTPPVNITNEALPVQLTAFGASIVQQTGFITLKWSTASEINNYGFEVQKAATDDGAAYETIANSFVAGHGTTLELHAYAFTDVTASQGTSYYRLKQIDLDGTVHYSDGVRPSGVTDVADRPLPTVYVLDQNYPNPFNPVTTISFALPKESRVTLEVFNLLGQRIAVLVNETRSAGYYTQKFDGTNTGSGIYFYRITAGEFSMSRKLILTR